LSLCKLNSRTSSFHPSSAASRADKLAGIGPPFILTHLLLFAPPFTSVRVTNTAVRPQLVPPRSLSLSLSLYSLQGVSVVDLCSIFESILERRPFGSGPLSTRVCLLISRQHTTNLALLRTTQSRLTAHSQYDLPHLDSHDIASDHG
jgi:hypothetical protein